MKAITTDVQVRNLKPAAEDYRRTVGDVGINDGDAQKRFGHNEREGKESRQSAQVDLGLLYLSILYFRLGWLLARE